MTFVSPACASGQSGRGVVGLVRSTLSAFFCSSFSFASTSCACIVSSLFPESRTFFVTCCTLTCSAMISSCNRSFSSSFSVKSSAFRSRFSIAILIFTVASPILCHVRNLYLQKCADHQWTKNGRPHVLTMICSGEMRHPFFVCQTEESLSIAFWKICFSSDSPARIPIASTYREQRSDVHPCQTQCDRRLFATRILAAPAAGPRAARGCRARH